MQPNETNIKSNKRVAYHATPTNNYEIKKIKQNSAITLIALVITIIVLLILAAVTLNIVLGENGIFAKARTSKNTYEYSSAKETLNLKLLEIQTDCIEKSQEYTLNLIADKLGMTEEETIEIIKYYEATASTELTIPESICGIVVIVKQYPEYKFLIGEEGTIEGITTGEVPNTYDATKFQSIEEFEQQHNFGAQTGTNQSSSPTITKYTVTFNTNGGSSVASQEVSAGGTATRPATDPTKDNYTFENWYSDSELTTEYNFASAVNGNITIYAKWDDIDSAANMEALCEDTTANITTKLSDATYRETVFNSTNFYDEVVEAGQNSNIIAVLNSNNTYKSELSTILENSWNEKLNAICYWIGNKCMLYHNGDFCTTITGGWTSVGYVESCNIGWGKAIAPTITNFNNFFRAKITTNGLPYSTGEVGKSGSIYPTNTINYNNYSKICIEYNNATMYGYNEAGIILFVKGGNNGFDSNETNSKNICYSQPITGNTNTTLKWTHNSVPGSSIVIYLQTAIDNRYGTDPTTIDIYKVWLEN